MEKKININLNFNNFYENLNHIKNIDNDLYLILLNISKKEYFLEKVNEKLSILRQDILKKKFEKQINYSLVKNLDFKQNKTGYIISKFFFNGFHIEKISEMFLNLFYADNNNKNNNDKKNDIDNKRYKKNINDVYNRNNRIQINNKNSKNNKSNIYDISNKNNIENNYSSILPVIIYIEDLYLFCYFLFYKKFNFLSNKYLKIIFIYENLNDKVLELFITNYIKRLYNKPYLIFDKNYEKYFKSTINKFDSLVFNKINFFISDAFTFIHLLYFQVKSIVKNKQLIKNSLYLPKSNSEIENIKNNLNKKAIIITAGYSITNLNIDRLKKLQEKGYYIISVDTSYRFLKLNGIIPDLTVILDSQILNYYDFLFLNPEKETFIVDISANHKIINKLIKNNNIVIFFSSILKNIKNEWSAPSIIAHEILVNSNLAKIPTFGNITFAAISFAKYFFNKIYVIGFDREFYKYIYHCKHSLDYYYFQKTQNFINTFNSLQLKFSLNKIDTKSKKLNHFNKLNQILMNENSFFKDIMIINKNDYDSFMESISNNFENISNIKYAQNSYNYSNSYSNKSYNNKNYDNKKENKKNDFIKLFISYFKMRSKLDYNKIYLLLKNSITLYYNFDKYKFKNKLKRLLK